VGKSVFHAAQWMTPKDGPDKSLNREREVELYYMSQDKPHAYSKLIIRQRFQLFVKIMSVGQRLTSKTLVLHSKCWLEKCPFFMSRQIRFPVGQQTHK
jgi:hypothetical protein